MAWQKLRRGFPTLVILISLLVTACNAVLTPPPPLTPTPAAGPILRPTVTVASERFLTPIPPTATFTPSPSPTPVMHFVEQGDTLFGIALEYGVSVAALEQANGLDPNDYLRIGQGLIIPIEQEGTSEASAGVVVPMDNVLLPTPTPHPLQITGVALYRTPVEGVWCMGEVINETGVPVTNVQVRIDLVAEDGTALASASVLAAADYLPPGERAPFALLFKSPPPGVADARVTLLRGESVGAITAGFVPLPVEGAEGGVSGPQYRVAGRVLNDTGAGVTRVAVVVTLYDAEGRVAGYRQQMLMVEGLLAAGADQAFQLLLTPQGVDLPQSFRVLVWGSRAE